MEKHHSRRSTVEKLRIFFSHKRSDEEVATKIISLLETTNRERLHIFSSAKLPFGELWNDAIARELDQADWLFLLYTDAHLQWDWCLYEAGYFVGGRRKSKQKRLFTLLRQGDPPRPLHGWQPVEAKQESWEQLLAQLCKKMRVRPDIRPQQLAEMAGSIVGMLAEPPQRTRLSHELKVILEGDQIQEVCGTRKIPRTAKVKVHPELARAFGREVQEEVQWQALTQRDQDELDGIPESLDQAIGDVVARLATDRRLDSPVIPVTLPKDRGVGFMVVEEYERRGTIALVVVMHLARCEATSVWPAQIFADASRIWKEAQAKLAIVKHVQKAIVDGLKNGEQDLNPWILEYSAADERLRMQKLSEVIQSANSYVHAITVDHGAYLTNFWSSQSFRELYIRTNDMAAQHGVKITRVFVVEESTFRGEDEGKCTLIKTIANDTHQRNVNELMLLLDDAKTYGKREVRSCLVCDDWIASEPATDGKLGYVSGHDDNRIEELKEMCSWLIEHATPIHEVEWLR